MKETFKIQVSKKFFAQDDLLYAEERQVRVLEKPTRKWYKMLLQIITIGLYNAPYEYKVELVK